MADIFAIDVFVEPPGRAYGNYALNPSFLASSQIQTSWRPQADLPRWNLIAARPYPDQRDVHGRPPHWVLFQNTTETHYTWVIDKETYLFGIDDGDTAVFYLYLSNPESEEPYANAATHYINITKAYGPLTTAAIPSSTSSSLLPSSTGLAPNASIDPANHMGTRNPPKAASSLSTGAVAGIAVAVMAVMLFILGGISLFFWRRHQQRKRRDQLVKEQEENSRPRQSSSSSGQQLSAQQELHGTDAEIWEAQGTAWTEVHAELHGEPKIIAELDGQDTMRVLVSPEASLSHPETNTWSSADTNTWSSADTYVPSPLKPDTPTTPTVHEDEPPGKKGE